MCASGSAALIGAVCWWSRYAESATPPASAAPLRESMRKREYIALASALMLFGADSVATRARVKLGRVVSDELRAIQQYSSYVAKLLPPRRLRRRLDATARPTFTV